MGDRAPRPRRSLAISFNYMDAADWPQPYCARQIFRIRGRRLEIDLSLQNLGDGAMPGGFGLHPYFPRRRELRFETWATHHWPPSSGFRPEEEELAPFGRGRIHPGSVVAAGSDWRLSRWLGYARMDWPTERRRIEIRASPGLPSCVLFAPEDRDLLCLEPSSHFIGGFGALDQTPRTGVRILNPGETMRARVTMTCRHLPTRRSSSAAQLAG